MTSNLDNRRTSIQNGECLQYLSENTHRSETEEGHTLKTAAVLACFPFLSQLLHSYSGILTTRTHVEHLTKNNGYLPNLLKALNRSAKALFFRTWICFRNSLLFFPDLKLRDIKKKNTRLHTPGWRVYA